MSELFKWHNVYTQNMYKSLKLTLKLPHLCVLCHKTDKIVFLQIFAYKYYVIDIKSVAWVREKLRNRINMIDWIEIEYQKKVELLDSNSNNNFLEE